MKGARFEQPKSAEASSGRGVRMWDRIFRRVVAVKRIPTGLSAHGSGAKLTEAWAKWFEVAYAGFLKPGLLDYQNDFLLREWVSGFSLMDLVRHRHRLESTEALLLLIEAAPILDRAGEVGLLDHIALDKWFVAFQEDLRPEAILRQLQAPVGEWPHWTLRADPLRLSLVVQTADDRTYVGNFFPPPDVVPAVAAAHRLARELMGGSSGHPKAPLATLNDPGNQVLATALEPKRFQSAVEFVKALAAALEESAAPPQPRPIVTPPFAQYDISGPARAAGAGEALILEPMTAEGSESLARPLQLVSRRELRLGRSTTEADLTLRFVSKEPEAVELTKLLSRVHARLRWENGEVRLYDGSAERRSGHGTFTREGALEDPKGLLLRQMTMVQFGTHWRATIVPIPHPREQPAIHGAVAAEGAPASPDPIPPPWAAVHVVPSEGARARTETVWLLEEAGFGIDDRGALIWDTEALGTAPAAFRRHGGGFWLLNRRLDGVELSVNQCPVPPGFAAALRKGMPVVVGRNAWRVHLGA